MKASDISRNRWWHGSDELPGSPRWLSAGPVAAGLEDGQLRGIYCQGREVVRRIYGAVRDRYWNTVSGVITGLTIDEADGGFRITFQSEHVSSEVDFVWNAVITGSADGTISYVFEGEARRAMAKNRIGLCVLLPLSLAGKAGSPEYVSGDRASVMFPVLADPMQPVRGLHDFRALTVPDAGEGTRLEFAFEGDVFEIEDQRNWTDASYKIYSTPQRIPMPAQLPAGHRVRQVVTLRVIPSAAGAATCPPSPDDTVAIAAGNPLGVLPEAGTGVASHGAALSDREIARLKALGLAHCRVEADPAKPGWQDELRRRLRETALMHARAEVVLTVSDDVEAEAQAAADVAEEFAGLVVRWLILTRGAPATRAGSLETAREILAGEGIVVGGGTDADFFQLNNNRPQSGALDFVSVPLRPCAHQFDRATMIENLEGQHEVLKAMREIWPDLPLVVSPVSIRTRAQKGPVAAAGELPAQADVRQMSLFLAGWTIGCLRTLAAAGAASVTLFQTTGLRGIMERESGSDAPGEFQSVPGGVFPVYFVLAALAGWRGASVADTGVPGSDVECLCLTKDGRHRTLLANLCPQPRRVVLRESGGSPVSASGVVILDADNAGAAVADPEAWLAAPPVQPVVAGTIDLPPFAVAWLDW